MKGENAVTPSRLEIIGVLLAFMGAAAMVSAAFILAGLAVALIVGGSQLLAAGLLAVRAAAMAEREA